jgi:methionyl-tRNA formyltransferase
MRDANITRFMTFLVVTTQDLPEAYALVEYLVTAGQNVAVLSIAARSPTRPLRVIRRLRRTRGLVYVGDLLLGHLLQRSYLTSHVPAFPDMPAGRIAALKRSITHHAPSDPHAPDALAFARRTAPDYILLAGAPVLKPDLYGLAREGALNRHLGVSPDFRGSDCAIWALALNRLDCVGFTIHLVSDRVDGGDVLLQHRVPIRPDLGFADFLAFMQGRASAAYVSVLARIVSGQPLDRRRQAPGGHHYPPAGWSALHRARLHYEAARAARRIPATA